MNSGWWLLDCKWTRISFNTHVGTDIVIRTLRRPYLPLLAHHLSRGFHYAVDADQLTEPRRILIKHAMVNIYFRFQPAIYTIERAQSAFVIKLYSSRERHVNGSDPVIVVSQHGEHVAVHRIR